MKMKTAELNQITAFSQGIQVPTEEQSFTHEEGKVRFIRIVDITSNGSEPPRFISFKGEKFMVEEPDLFMVRYGSPQIVKGWSGAIANNFFKVIV